MTLPRMEKLWKRSRCIMLWHAPPFARLDRSCIFQLPAKSEDSHRCIVIAGIPGTLYNRLECNKKKVFKHFSQFVHNISLYFFLSSDCQYIR